MPTSILAEFLELLVPQGGVEHDEFQRMFHGMFFCTSTNTAFLEQYRWRPQLLRVPLKLPKNSGKTKLHKLQNGWTLAWPMLQFKAEPNGRCWGCPVYKQGFSNKRACLCMCDVFLLCVLPTHVAMPTTTPESNVAHEDASCITQA